MAIIGITAVKYPESRMSVAFLDQMVPHSFSIGSVSNLQTRKHYIIQLKMHVDGHNRHGRLLL